LPKRPSDFAPEVIGFGSVTLILACSQARISGAVEVAAIGNGIEMLSAENPRRVKTRARLPSRRTISR
jgi:hypothetical protein